MEHQSPSHDDSSGLADPESAYEFAEQFRGIDRGPWVGRLMGIRNGVYKLITVTGALALMGFGTALAEPIPDDVRLDGPVLKPRR